MNPLSLDEVSCCEAGAGRGHTEEAGAAVQQVNRACRTHTARMLIDHTDWRLGEIAFAAGFGSIRQFNDVMHLWTKESYL